MKLDQNEICVSYWKAAFYTVRKPHDYNTYTHQVLIKGVYYGKWGIPLTATKQYIDKLWKEKYSEYDSLDDFEFTRAELEYIYCLAKNDPFEIDKSYINGAFGNNANYEYIFKQRKKIFFL